MGSYNIFIKILIFTVVNLNIKDGGKQVEAMSKQILPVGGWFQSMERSYIQPYQDSHDNMEQQQDFIPYYEPRPRLRPPKKRESVPKKKKVLKKKKVRRSKMHNKTEEFQSKKRKRKKIKKIKRSKKIKNGKYVETTVKERIFNHSDLIDLSKRSKPVDIIVHIKMNE